MGVKKSIFLESAFFIIIFALRFANIVFNSSMIEQVSVEVPLVVSAGVLPYFMPSVGI